MTSVKAYWTRKEEMQRNSQRKAREAKSSPVEKEKRVEFSHRWGIRWLPGGYTSIMNAMLRNYHRLGIAGREMMLIIHVASYAYESPNSRCHPALTSTIRKEMGYITNDAVINILEDLEEKGMVEVARRPGKPSIYDLSPFARMIERLVEWDKFIDSIPVFLELAIYRAWMRSREIS